MEICAACCQGCCECFNSCQDSNLALSCAIFGGPDCNCCKNKTEDVKGKYTKITNAPREIEMNRTELVF